MRICSTCLLPETYPEIQFDQQGVCNYCSQYQQKSAAAHNSQFSSEQELIDALEKYKKVEGNYHVLVSASGGVDSNYALIQLVEKYKLKPLVWYNDHGYEHEIATNNVRKLCKALDVELIIWQHDVRFMKKLWKLLFETQADAASTCFVCANILYWNAVELAERNNIKLIINGYSKGQAAFDKERGRLLLNTIIKAILQTGDDEFFETFIKKYEIMNKFKGYQVKQDLLGEIEPDKILVIPFFIFNFYKTDKEYLKRECKERFDWRQVENPYPDRTTNCLMNWLTTYVDLQRVNYSIYTDEYSGLIRAGEITREQACADLEFNPPPGLLERLAKEVGIDLSSILTTK